MIVQLPLLGAFLDAGTAEAEVVIEAFLPMLHVLHTKTRPKRLAVLGSDGKQYKYLLKVGSTAS